MHSETSKHSSDMDVDQPQNKASFTTLTNLNKIYESKSEMSHDDNKCKSSNNAKVKFLFEMQLYQQFEKYQNSSWYMNFEFSGKSLNFQNRKTEFSL